MGRISVVITAYNLEAFIRDAVDSVLAQSLQPHEIIVVDDCSTDATAAHLESYEGRIRVIRKARNAGALRAALTGLTESTGDIVAFLDGDDTWAPTKLERCVSMMRENEKMILVSHQHVRVDSGLRPLGVRDDTHTNIDSIIRECSSVEERSERFKRSILEKKGFWLGSAYVIRRSALDLIAFQAWVDSLPHPEDVYLDLVLAPWLVLSHPEGMIGLVDEPLFLYREHGNNSCNDYRSAERALRSVRRAYNTTEAAARLNHLFSGHPLARDGAVAHERSLNHYRLLLSLYSDERLEALTRYLSLLAGSHLSPRSALVDGVRLASVGLGGPRLLLELKNRVTRLKASSTRIRRWLS